MFWLLFFNRRANYWNGPQNQTRHLEPDSEDEGRSSHHHDNSCEQWLVSHDLCMCIGYIPFIVAMQSMEEADILGDHIVIMANGELK